jgi:homocysteine S-methyltransferase
MLRMAQTSTVEAAQKEGTRIAQEMLDAVRPYVQGVQLSLPRNQYAAAAEVLASAVSSA